MFSGERARAVRWLGIGIAAFFSVAFAVWLVLVLYVNPYENVVPTYMRKEVGYTVYYPSKLPEGFVYTTNSTKLASNVLYYEFSNGGSKIYVSQQTMPDSPPNINKIDNFRKVTTPIGEAVIGEKDGKRSVIIFTASSIVTLIGSVDISNQVFEQIIKDFKAI